jgi:hypothetical protein
MKKACQSGCSLHRWCLPVILCCPKLVVLPPVHANIMVTMAGDCADGESHLCLRRCQQRRKRDRQIRLSLRSHGPNLPLLPLLPTSHTPVHNQCRSSAVKILTAVMTCRQHALDVAPLG